MQQLNCPFCGWHRFEDMTKGGKIFDRIAAEKEFIEHVAEKHREDWNRLVALWR